MSEEEHYHQEPELTPEYLEDRQKALEASEVVRQFLQDRTLVDERGSYDPKAVYPLKELRNLLNRKLESA